MINLLNEFHEELSNLKVERSQKMNRDRQERNKGEFNDGPRLRMNKSKGRSQGRQGWGIGDRLNVRG